MNKKHLIIGGSIIAVAAAIFLIVVLGHDPMGEHGHTH